MELRKLKKGQYFTLKPIEYPEERQVWVKGPYDRESKAFSCHRFDDTCLERMMKADKRVYTDFIF